MRTREQIKEYQKLWRKRNPDKGRVYSKRWRKNNYQKSLEYQRDYQKKWRQENRQKSRDAVRKSYYKNHAERLKDRREYYKKNKQKENKYRVRLAMGKYRSNPESWIIMNLRSRLLRVLNRGTQKLRKSGHTYKLLGADIGMIKKYLEKKFKKGMTWNNRGKWHIDHIKPLSSFDLSKSEQQQRAFHYTNLQPLWAKDNLKKGNKSNES